MIIIDIKILKNDSIIIKIKVNYVISTGNATVNFIIMYFVFAIQIAMLIMFIYIMIQLC